MKRGARVTQATVLSCFMESVELSCDKEVPREHSRSEGQVRERGILSTLAHCKGRIRLTRSSMET